jgi:hypothetical protein
MQITVGKLKKLFAEAMAEAKVGASDAYMKKERVREHLQQHLIELVKAGDISGPDDLEAFWVTVDAATKALQAVPFEVWTKMTGSRPNKKR